MKTTQKLLYIFVGVIIANVITFAVTPVIAAQIEAVFNSVNISIDGSKVASIGQNYILDNGTEVPYSISYNGTTYLPMRKMGELLGFEVEWQADNRDVLVQSITNTQTSSVSSNTPPPQSSSSLTNTPPKYNQTNNNETKESSNTSTNSSSNTEIIKTPASISERQDVVNDNVEKASGNKDDTTSNIEPPTHIETNSNSDTITHTNNE